MSIDRAATLRQAETLLRQGQLESAIAEYQALADDQPRDWNTANLLGDLHVRAGQIDRAVARFVRTAESLRKEGFLSRAAALYKKILKLLPDDDHALVCAGELAAEQGLLADARLFFGSAASGRRSRGEAAGALEIVVRLGALDPQDVPARVAAAHARRDLGDLRGAVQDLNDLHVMLLESGDEEQAAAVLRDAAGSLTFEAIGDDRDLLFDAAAIRLRLGETLPALEMVDTLLASSPAHGERVLALAVHLAPEDPDTAFALADRVASVRIAAADWKGAADVLRGFVAVVPDHDAATARLADVSLRGAAASSRGTEPRVADDAHADTGTRTASPSGQADPKQAVPEPPPDIESVFEGMRDRVVNRSPDDAAEVAYARGATLLDAGQFEQAIEHLRLAMRAPTRRFASAIQLARAYQESGRPTDAIQWLGHALDVADVSPAERFDTLHRLADLLEASGEPESALAVCLELQADAGDFRDVGARIARLSRTQTGG